MIVGTLIDVADPRLIKLVMKGEEVIGFAFAYPDISAGLQKAGGNLWPLGWYHVLRERTRTKWVNRNGIGVLPSYQGLGPGVSLYAELYRGIKALGFEHIEFVQVNESNSASRATSEALGVTWYKRHRSCRRAI